MLHNKLVVKLRDIAGNLREHSVIYINVNLGLVFKTLSFFSIPIL